jgi:hypothetical protein
MPIALLSHQRVDFSLPLNQRFQDNDFGKTAARE